MFCFLKIYIIIYAIYYLTMNDITSLIIFGCLVEAMKKVASICYVGLIVAKYLVKLFT